MLMNNSFDGEVVATEMFDNPEKREQFDINAFITRHSKEIRFPEMVACATALKSEYPKVGQGNSFSDLLS